MLESYYYGYKKQLRILKCLLREMKVRNIIAVRQDKQVQPTVSDKISWDT